MKSELDSLMAERGLDALLLWLDEAYSAAVDYLTNGAHITRALIIKRRGAAPVIFASSMETDEAAKSGLQIELLNAPRYFDLVKAHDGNQSLAMAGWWGECLNACGVSGGRVAIHGTGDLAYILTRVEELKAVAPGYTFVGESDPQRPLFSTLYQTKDADELLRLRSVAARTNQVLEAAWNFIAAHYADGDRVVNDDGHPLTIGAFKRFVLKLLLDHDLEDPGMIFAQGRDAGFPHNRGEEDQELRTGQPIVFDLFPREKGGGYYHDLTRTWSLDYATPDVQAVYDQVMEAFDIGVEVARAGVSAKSVQEAVQDHFEALGYATARSQPGTQVGYVHGLGHGIGLNIHEAPNMSHLSKDTLKIGNVLTIEPGLYDPDKGYGVRVEDSCYIDENGQVVSLTPFRKDLVLPLKRR
jgi:Xaa-Pro aminopeptidase